MLSLMLPTIDYHMMAYLTTSVQQKITTASIFLAVACLISWSNAQISTPCTTSMISSFTPCFNFITGSSGGNGTSPSSDCCKSFKSLLQTSVDCACLVITANVPIPLPVNRTLALSLPSACNGGVPMRCKASGSPLPAPGPVLFAPPPPMAASPHTAPSPSPHLAPGPLSPRASKAVLTLPPVPAPESDSDTPLDMSPSSPATKPDAGSASNPGIRPVLSPSSSSNRPLMSSIPFLAIIFGLMFHGCVL